MISDGSLIAGTVDTNNGIWHRPISEMIASSVVTTTRPQAQPLSIYPNPAIQQVKISFSLSVSSQASVTIFNQLGQEIAGLFDGYLGAGEHEFAWDASSITNGTYFCVVRLGDRVMRVPVVVAK